MTEINSICCIGAGYVGGPTMAVIADRCPHIQVRVVDLNAARIADWNDSDLSRLPVFEPGLEEIVRRCRGKNLHFSTEVEAAIASSDMIFLSVNTPTKLRGVGAGQASDLRWIEASARQVGKFAQGHTIVIEKSTLPVRTAATIQAILSAAQSDAMKEQSPKSFSILSNPEFLAEGTAIADLQNPDRVLIGGEDPDAVDSLATIYKNWVPEDKILRTNLWSSELSKLTANCFLAQRISSINSIAAVCEATGANVQEVSKAIGTDSRIGSKFLKPGPGFGGSCFQKDILNLVYLCGHYGLHDVANYWNSVVSINEWQQHRISKLVVQRLFGTVTAKRLGVLGFAFKADTNDTREAPAIQVCRDLLEEGASLTIYDPKVKESQIQSDLGQPPESVTLASASTSHGSWRMTDSVEGAAEESDALIILTEWRQFSEIDWESIAPIMRHPAWIFDARAIINRKLALSQGLNVWTIGHG